jgi:hypothetical protein
MNAQMTSQTPEQFKGVINSDPVVALLGVAAHQYKSTGGICPSDELLAAFINAELKGKQRQTMLAHLNRCPTCYHHWLETASYVKSLKSVEDKKPFIALLTELLDIFRHPLDNWKPLVSLAATVVLMVAMVLWLPQPINSQINDSYFSVIHNNPNGFSQVLEELPLETTTLGFNDVDRSQSAQAFSAGIEMGYVTLTNTTPSAEVAAWADTDWADEYDLGRWFVLLWTMAQSPAPADFWAQQPAIGETLQARFSERSPDDITKTVLDVLTNIQLLLTQLQNQPNNRGMAYRLSHHLEMAMSGISEL